MQITIDKAGRLVVPEAVREEARLHPATRVRFRVRDGRIETEQLPLAIALERRGSVVAAVLEGERPLLSASDVEETAARLRSAASSPGGSRIGG